MNIQKGMQHIKIIDTAAKGLKRFSFFSLVAIMVTAMSVSVNTNQAQATPTCGSAIADLWFGNDESGSVDSGEFNNVLDFMYQISDNFVYDSVTGMQAGAFAWDTAATDVVIPVTEDFGDPDDSGLIQDSNVVIDSDSLGIRELYPSRTGSGGTSLTVATQHMVDLINGGNGRRTGVRQVSIILTDATASQLTTDSTNWINAADDLRAAGEGDNGIVLVLIAEAADAYTNNTSGATAVVDSVAGAEGLILTVPTYADAADPVMGYVDQVTESICDAVEPPTPAPTDDSDNISITEEDAGPNSGDGNNDGTVDSEQSDVTTAINNAIGKYTTTAVSGNCDTIDQVNFYKEPNMSLQDDAYDYPLGLHGFKVSCATVGGSVAVTYYWDKVYDVSKWTYRKFNAATNKYIDFNSQVTYGTAVIGGTTVTTVSYSVTDGGQYDGDGVANGEILDPIGPTVLAATTPNTGLHSSSLVIPVAFLASGFSTLAVANFTYKKRS